MIAEEESAKLREQAIKQLTEDVEADILAVTTGTSRYKNNEDYLLTAEQLELI